jgi:hypothetical protein
MVVGAMVAPTTISDLDPIFIKVIRL